MAGTEEGGAKLQLHLILSHLLKHHDSMGMNLSKLWEKVKDRGAWCAVGHGVTKSWTRLSNSKITTERGGSNN